MSSPPVFSGIGVAQSLFFCVHCILDHCPFVLFLLAIVLSVLRYTDPDCPFGIFKLFLKLYTEIVVHLKLNSSAIYTQTI